MSAEGVRRASLGSLAQADMGRNYPSDVQTDAGGGAIPIFGAAKTAGPTSAAIQRGTLGHLARSSLGARDVIVESGDLVLGLNVPTGPPIIADETAVLSLRHVRLRPRKGSIVTSEWLFVWASSSDFRDQVASRARSVRGRMVLRELRGFSVPLATREQQMVAFESLRRTVDATRLAERQLALLMHLREAVVDQAVALAARDGLDA